MTWISTQKQMPLQGQHVLGTNGVMGVRLLCCEGSHWIDPFNRNPETYGSQFTVVYWMPLPEKPVQLQEKE